MLSVSELGARKTSKTYRNRGPTLLKPKHHDYVYIYIYMYVCMYIKYIHMLPSPLMYPRFVLELCGIAVASLQTFPISKYTKELICSSVPAPSVV